MCTNDFEETLKLHFSTQSQVYSCEQGTLSMLRVRTEAQKNQSSSENEYSASECCRRIFPQVSCGSSTKEQSIKQQHNTQVQVSPIKYSWLQRMQACYYQEYLKGKL